MRSENLALPAIVTMIALSWPVAAVSKPLRPITLVVSNLADVPRAFMTRAERDVVRLYSRIGVTLIWEEHDPSTGARSARPSDGMLMRMTIVREDLRKVPDAAALGVAPLIATRPPSANVYYSRVERTASHHATERAIVVGHTIAHEVAHLLIPDYGHSRKGLMRAVWDGLDFMSAAQGQLVFSDEQGALIRGALAR